MKRILIISEYFAPTQAIASNRWSKIAYYLKQQHDVSIDVLTIRRNYTHKESIMGYSLKDDLLKKETKAINKFYVIDYNKFIVFLVLLVDLIKRYILKIDNTNKLNESVLPITSRDRKFKILKIRDYLEMILLNISNYYGGIKCIKNHVSDYDVVISTYGPYWPNLVGNYIKKKNKNIKWIADFRDYCTRTNYSMLHRYINNIYLKKICKRTDLVYEVIDGMDVECFAKRKIKVLPNGYDPVEIKNIGTIEKFTILYTGTYYREDDVSPLFGAINQLIDERNIDSNDLEFLYAGSGFEAYREVATKYNLESFVVNLGVVSRSESMELQRKSAALIQLGWNNKNEHMMWTGKTYEYMMAQRPIIYIVNGDEKDSLPARNIHKLGGVCFESVNSENDMHILKEYLKKIYVEWKTTGTICLDRDEAYIKTFSYPNLSMKVWNGINEVKYNG